MLGDSACAVALAGEVDMYTAPAFERVLFGAIEDGARDVVADLTDASFIDSSFLGVLVAGRTRLEDRGGRLSVVCTDRNLVRVFEITGLDRVFAIHPTLEEALIPSVAAARAAPGVTAATAESASAVSANEQERLAALRRNGVAVWIDGRERGV